MAMGSWLSFVFFCFFFFGEGVDSPTSFFRFSSLFLSALSPRRKTQQQRRGDAPDAASASCCWSRASILLLLYPVSSIYLPPFPPREEELRAKKKSKHESSKDEGKTMVATAAGGRKPHPPPPPPLHPFRFGARRDRIDWGALHGVDLEKMVCLFSGGQAPFLSSLLPPTAARLLLTSSLSFSFPRFFSNRRPTPTSTRSKSASLPSRTATWTPSPAGSSRR